MSFHQKIVKKLEEQGISLGYTIEKTIFSIPHRPKVRVDVHWKRESESVVWEVELKARYEEKIFKFHLLKETYSNVCFGLVVQRNDSKNQVLRIAKKLFSQSEREALQIKTIQEVTGRKIEDFCGEIHPLFWVHNNASLNCVRLFSPSPFDDGFNRGLRLVGLYLKIKGSTLEEIKSYLIWLAPKLGLPEFEVNNAMGTIAKMNTFPSCDRLRKYKVGRSPFQLCFGDLNLEINVCSFCEWDSEI